MGQARQSRSLEPSADRNWLTVRPFCQARASASPLCGASRTRSIKETSGDLRVEQAMSLPVLQGSGCECSLLYGKVVRKSCGARCCAAPRTSYHWEATTGDGTTVQNSKAGEQSWSTLEEAKRRAIAGIGGCRHARSGAHGACFLAVFTFAQSASQRPKYPVW